MLQKTALSTSDMHNKNTLIQVIIINIYFVV